MTRINVVPPQELCDQHLLAEYRELPRVFRLAKALPEKEIPLDYVLGSGHVKFFYNKLAFLTRRYTNLVMECKRRGFNVKYEEADRFGHTQELYGDYEPTTHALLINRARILKRKPAKARYMGKEIAA